MKKIGFATVAATGLVAAILGLAAPAQAVPRPAMRRPSWRRRPTSQPGSTVICGSIRSARR